MLDWESVAVQSEELVGETVNVKSTVEPGVVENPAPQEREGVPYWVVCVSMSVLMPFHTYTCGRVW